MDLLIYGAVAIIVALIALKLTFYTVKKVVINVILGALVYYIATEILGIHMDMGFIMWALTVLFGPIPVILLAIYSFIK